MRRFIGLAAVAACLMAAPALAQDGKAQIEAVMRDYLELWNKHDSATIIQRVYRLPDGHRWQKQEGLQAEFDRLKAEGYDHSDTSSVKGCILTADTGQVELRFVRLKTDGSFMPPKDRISVYQLKKFSDGWRVTGMGGLPAGGAMECPPVAK